MGKWQELSPEMQDKWNEDMKRVKEELDKMDYKQIFKQIYGLEMKEIRDYTFEIEYANYYEEEVNQPSIDQQITTLKYQLKHCKNYLERQNIERELNRLYKERR